MEIKKEVLTPEEIAADTEATKEVNQEEIRAGIISEFGFDETADADKIEKLTSKEVENRKRLSVTIGQKIKFRDKLKELEGKPAVVAPAVKTETQENLSTKDIIALTKAGIDDEDIDEVVEYARFKKISIGEALKSTVVKATLAEKKEFRDTANATSTGTQRRVVTKVSNEEIMKKANKGEIPEPKSEDAERLFWARRGRK